jgi:AraC-like DNA-binding protein
MYSRSSDSDAVQGLDPLTEVLQDLRLSGSFYCRSELRAPWGLTIPGRGLAAFHFVAEGACFLRKSGSDALRLESGDFVLVPRGEGHTLSDTPDGASLSIEELPHESIGQNAAVLRHGGGGARSLLICGAVRFDDPAVHPLLDLMPDVLQVRAAAAEAGHLLRSMLDAIAREALSPKPGAATVMTRLADVLVIHAVRSWLETGPASTSGWLGAFRDAQIGRALALIHRRPEETWTVSSLAARVHMSRSVFSERFTQLAGAPPLQYLTRWRMHLASRWLKSDGLSLGEVASRLGYDSEPAFRRAFKRHMGIPPGAARRGLAGRVASA